MERTAIGKLREHIGQTVKINGWLHTLRDQKKMQFLVLRDLTGMVQVVFEKNNDPELAARISTLNQDSALTITGTVVDAPQVKLGGLEMTLTCLKVESAAEAPLPFDPSAETLPTLDFRLDWRFLDLRRPYNALMFQVQTTMEAAMREFWVRNDFIEIQTPKLMGRAESW
ncbi:MAG TPA: OB-fold nucleic acid binding domain-containing protein, partial [Anaerolineaceae bacterium]|nr:OB-fold nucleic acid binding domain-containing protein [Anaerolineaceae bacterium]